MYKNQYFISTAPFPTPSNGEITVLENFIIWTSENLEITKFQNNHNYLVLLGFVFNPKFPEKSNMEILQDLIEKPLISFDFFNYFNQLTGRFILIIKFKGKTIILHDPAAQRQFFYHFDDNKFWATSSPKLFYDLTKFDFNIPPEKQKIIDSKRFKLLEEWFPGNEYIDEKLIRLLPNFYLEIESQCLKRIPFLVSEMDKVELKNYISQNIYGAMESCVSRFNKTMLGITAGGDSRLILSCTPHEESIDYFLYKRESENDTDLKIAKKLTEKKKINLSVIQPDKISESFLSSYKTQFLRPRILSKLRNIEWLKNNFENKNALVVVGYAGELYRNSTNSINPYHKKFNSAEDLNYYFHYPPTRYLKNSMEDWWKHLNDYTENCKNLLPIDLFHWEHHMANYCAQYSYEQDFSDVEIFCPLANRQVILSLIHNLKPNERAEFIQNLIDEKCPEWKGIPYNPKSYLKNLKDKVFKVLPLKIVNRIINR